MKIYRDDSGEGGARGGQEDAEQGGSRKKSTKSHRK